MSENPNGTGRGRQVGAPFVPEEPTQAVRDFFGPAFSDVAEYARMLEEEGELRGLLGPRDMERIWSRHIVNSAAVLDFMPRKEGREVLDVGSGSGLPGIVIAACRPDLHIHLAEPMERRVEWLEEVVEGLGLDSIFLANLTQADAEVFVTSPNSFALESNTSCLFFKIKSAITYSVSVKAFIELLILYNTLILHSLFIVEVFQLLLAKHFLHSSYHNLVHLWIPQQYLVHTFL